MGIIFCVFVYNFSVDHSSIKQEKTLNADQYLMIKNNIISSVDLLCYWAL